MNKKLSYLMLGTGLALTLSSCENKDVDLNQNPEAQDVFIPTVVADYDAIKPSKFLEVNVEEGYYAEVIVDGVVICTTLESTIVEVPNDQFSVFTKSEEPTEVVINTQLYDPNNKPLGLMTEPNGAFMYKTLLFEDKLVGSDYDYNDLIIHVQQKVTTNREKFRIYIQPVAMGNAQKLTLGADIYATDKVNHVKMSTIIFSEDVKRDLFEVENPRTFINTCYSDPDFDIIEGDGYPMYFVSPKPLTNHNPSEYSLSIPDQASEHFYHVTGDMSDKTFAINWFIINAYGDKIYAVPTVNHEGLGWTNEDGYPHGLVISKINNPAHPTVDGETCGWDWFDYPLEREHIANVYPDFSN